MTSVIVGFAGLEQRLPTVGQKMSMLTAGPNHTGRAGGRSPGPTGTIGGMHAAAICSGMAFGSEAQQASPHLANVFPHNVFGLWVQKIRNRHAAVPYAADFVLWFQYHRQGKRLLPPRAAAP